MMAAESEDEHLAFTDSEEERIQEAIRIKKCMPLPHTQFVTEFCHKGQHTKSKNLPKRRVKCTQVLLPCTESVRASSDFLHCMSVN